MGNETRSVAACAVVELIIISLGVLCHSTKEYARS